MKYVSAVYNAIKEYYSYNYDEIITDEQIDKMSRNDVLTCYLEWEGIIGYTYVIESICGLE